jgi:lipoprotein-releasing system permease protein
MKLSTALFMAVRAYRNGHGKKKTSRPLIGAILGIAFSLIPLIVVINISDGMIQGITGRYIETYSYHLQLFSYTNPSLEEFQTLAQEVEQIEGVTQSYVERRGFALAYSEKGRTGVNLRAIENELCTDDAEFRKYMEIKAGDFDLTAHRAVVLGQEVARQLQVQPGDSIKLLTGKIFPNGRYVPRVTPFVVQGIVSSGYQELDRLWVFIPLEKGAEMLAEDSSETLLGVKVEDPYSSLAPMVTSIRNSINQDRQWRAYTWMNLNRAQQKSYQTTKMMLQIIMALLVLVAVMNVSSSLIMLVMEKNVEIAILKCIGASPGDIGRVYRYIGLSAGVFGSLLGCMAGIAVSLGINDVISFTEGVVNFFITLFSQFKGIFTGGTHGDFQLLNSSYYLQDIPIDIEWHTLAIIVISTILLSWIASSLPAARAGRIRPLEVIRKH